MSYRTDLYSRYESTFRDPSTSGRASRPGQCDRLYPFRDWIPEDRHAAIVDVGCGSGDLLLALKYAGYTNISGVDLGAEQVASATEAGLEVSQGDATKYLQAHLGSFRIIIACDVMEHLSRDEALAFLQAARLALVANGAVLLRVPNAAAPRGTVYQHGDLTHETAFSPGSLRQLCNFVGARTVMLREDLPPCDRLTRVVRRILWAGVRQVYRFVDVVESGAAEEAYARNLLARVQF